MKQFVIIAVTSGAHSVRKSGNLSLRMKIFKMKAVIAMIKTITIKKISLKTLKKKLISRKRLIFDILRLLKSRNQYPVDTHDSYNAIENRLYFTTDLVLSIGVELQMFAYSELFLHIFEWSDASELEGNLKERLNFLKWLVYEKGFDVNFREPQWNGSGWYSESGGGYGVLHKLFISGLR
jgi:hypothetical protein